MSDIRNDKEKLKEFLMKHVKTDDEGRVLLSKDDEWREEYEWDEIYKEERPCTILESIEESLKEIKEYEEGKREFKTIEESKKMWEGWVEEVKNEHKGLDKEKKEILKSLMGSASSKSIDFNKVRDEWKYGNNEECEWDILANIFQEAIDRNEMSKEDVEKMIDKCIDEVRNEKHNK